MRHPRRSLRAFTLIELAIVLTIIGLLIGGIIGGQAIIKSAEINGTVTEITQNANAFQQFNNIYKAYPGDMSTATDYWGISGGATGSDDTCYASTAQGKTATCNGNGDRFISESYPAGDCTEAYLLWQHMANAGVIKGSYSGKSTLQGFLCKSRAGVNVPSGRYAKNSYFIYTRGTSGSTKVYFDEAGTGFLQAFIGTGYFDVVEFFGGVNPQSTFGPIPIFTTEEMDAIDRKLDDGVPANGNIRAIDDFAATCYTGTTYNLSSKGPRCAGFYAVTPIGM